MTDSQELEAERSVVSANVQEVLACSSSMQLEVDFVITLLALQGKVPAALCA